MRKTPGVLLIAYLCLASWTAPADQQRLSSANNDFAFTLMKQISKEQPAGNIFISPFSAACVLQMACGGAIGPTRADLQNALGVSGFDKEQVNRANKKIISSLNARKGVTLVSANALWYRQDIAIKPDFIEENRKFYGTTVGALDFESRSSAQVINTWARENTKGKIDGIVGERLNRESGLFLANVIYFKGEWEKPFDAKNTKKRVFYSTKSEQHKVSMMEQSRKFMYRRGTGYQAVRLVYEGWSIGMYVFLPDEDSSPEQLLKIMSGETWEKITEPGFAEREGKLILPKFKMRFDVELKESLRALGMKRVFADADFSGISDQPLSIAAVRQSAFIEVNEEGTEAVAATVAPIEMGVEVPQTPFQMIVNRPFLFLIEDKETGIILFMGVVHDPATAEA